MGIGNLTVNKDEILEKIKALETELIGLKDELNKSDKVGFKYIARECCFVGSSWVSTQMDGTDKSALEYFRYRQTEANANADLQLNKELMCIGALAEQIDPDYKNKVDWGSITTNWTVYYDRKYKITSNTSIRYLGVVYMPKEVAEKVCEILNNKGVDLC